VPWAPRAQEYQFHVQIFISGVTKGIVIVQREDNERNRRTVEIQFDSYSCYNRCSQGKEAYRARAVVSTTRRRSQKRRGEARCNARRAITLPLHFHSCNLRTRNHNGTTSACFFEIQVQYYRVWGTANQDGINNAREATRSPPVLLQWNADEENNNIVV